LKEVLMKKPDYKWLVVIVVVFNSFLQYIDMTIVNTALPTIGRFFRSGSSETAWVVTAYLLSFAMLIPVSGWLGDRYGTKRTFVAGLAFFVLGSLLCGLAGGLDYLVVFRIVQGIGAGIMAPVSTTMLYRVFPPEERSRVTAFIVVPTIIAPAIGPIVGGYLVQYVAWQGIFWINVPLGMIGLGVAVAALKEQVQRVEGRFDLPGFLLGTLGVGALIYALQQAGRQGGADSRVIGAAVGGGILVAAFAALELRREHPMANLRLFEDRLFSAGTASVFFVQALFIGGVFILPFFFQLEKGLSPFDSGLITFPTALGVGMAVPFAARSYHSVGPRRLLIASMILSSSPF
jgi:EmrB/QacA subfamily drug resistance transporter